jgi:hypothetical protein
MLFLGCLTLVHLFTTELESPSRDQLRYVDYAYHLNTHNTFGLGCGVYDKAPDPGNANVPLYPILLAGAATLDSNLNQNYYCALKRHGVRGDCLIGTNQQPDQTAPRTPDCPTEDFTAVLVVNHTLLFVSLLFLYLISAQLFRHPVLPWLTVFAAFGSGIFTDYSTRILTENLLLTLFLMMQYALLVYFRKPGIIAVAAVGLILALLTLTRPEYPYLALAAVLIFVGIALWQKQTRFLVHGFVLGLVFVLTISPWLVRNHQQFDRWTIAAGNYGEITLAYRVAYNHMDARHWLASFVYFLPDFGDSLTRRIFSEDWYWREIDARSGSYQDVTNNMLTATANGQLTLQDLLQHHVLADLPTHLATTIPLSWRGVFIAKYWGLIAFFTYLVFQYRQLRRGQYELAIIALPCWLLVGLHAGISINIPRYNLPLLSVYAVSLGWLLAKIWNRFRPSHQLQR